jgi:hypothetical protein
VSRHAVGRGSAVAIATYPSLHYHAHRTSHSRSAVRHLCARIWSRPPASEPVAGLITRPGTLADGRRATVAVNWTGSDQAVPLPATDPAGTQSHERATAPARRGILLVSPPPPALGTRSEEQGTGLC